MSVIHEMDGYFDDMLDRICSPDDEEAIVLMGEGGEEFAFEKIAVVPQDDGLYIIMKPVQPMDGVGEDEGLVFLVNEGMRRFELVVDEGIIDRIFQIYDDLVDQEEE